MAKEKNNVVESLEFFELTLNVSNSQIPISELIDAKGTGQWHSEGTSDILRTIKMEVDAFEIKV